MEKKKNNKIYILELIILPLIYGMVGASILVAMNMLWYKTNIFFMLGLSMIPVTLAYGSYYSYLSNKINGGN